MVTPFAGCTIDLVCYIRPGVTALDEENLRAETR